VRTLVRTTIPALIIGILAGLLLTGTYKVADALEHVLWDWLPETLGVGADGPWWIIAVLTATGLAVGATVWLAPGHAGEDPAKAELVSTPLKLIALPGVAIALVLGLAGGVSLGPENPIIAIGVGISVWLMARAAPQLPVPSVIIISTAGILGAMFGSPVAAALLLTEMLAEFRAPGAMWDKLFAPLVAASAGALTTLLIGEGMAMPELPAFELGNAWNLVSAPVIATVAALLGLGAAWLLPPLHRALHSLRHPVLYLGLGGLVLGILGAVGGTVTLFKGEAQAVQLVEDAPSMSIGQLALVTGVKVLALLVAAAASFRGGRIFPAMFIGIALGLLVHAIMPAVPETLAVAAATMGFVLAVSRSGWLSLFIAAAATGSVAVLSVLCLAILPAWLLVTRGPHMIVRDRPSAEAPAP
jgi:H+/Cl- antiporter ClcA